MISNTSKEVAGKCAGQSLGEDVGLGLLGTEMSSVQLEQRACARTAHRIEADVNILERQPDLHVILPLAVFHDFGDEERQGSTFSF